MARSAPMPHASFGASRVARGNRSSTCAAVLSLKRGPRYRAIRHVDGIERRQKIGGIENLSEARDTPIEERPPRPAPWRRADRRSAMKKRDKAPAAVLDTRERILRTASELFYREGTRAVGVDLIVAQSGVAKTSLYRHFATKDDLIEAFLLREDEDFWQHWDTVAARHEGAPREELDAQLKWIGDRIARPGYRGCQQINIAAEHADDKHPARKVAVAHKREMRRRLAQLAKAIGLDEPDTFALHSGRSSMGRSAAGEHSMRRGLRGFCKNWRTC